MPGCFNSFQAIEIAITKFYITLSKMHSHKHRHMHTRTYTHTFFRTTTDIITNKTLPGPTMTRVVYLFV